MNALKSLLQNVVKVKAHSAESNNTTNSSSLHSSIIANDTKRKNDDSLESAVDPVSDSDVVMVTTRLSENCKSRGNIQLISNNDEDCKILQETIFDLIRGIIDPEKPETLEELYVVKEEDVFVYRHDEEFWIRLEFTPTVPHCSLASLIGLCLRSKLETSLPDKHKLDIYIKDGTHSTADEINKQINDKERIAAAMENPNLRDLVNRCITHDG